MGPHDSGCPIPYRRTSEGPHPSPTMGLGFLQCKCGRALEPPLSYRETLVRRGSLMPPPDGQKPRTKATGLAAAMGGVNPARPPGNLLYAPLSSWSPLEPSNGESPHG